MARGPALDVGARIDGRVANQPGKVWTPVDFLDLGPRAAIDKSLQRLTADGKLSRIGRGLYYRAGTNSLTRRPTTPDVRAIVDAIARRDQSRIVVDGLTAANDLGLTTAVPARVTVITDARLRRIQIGKQRIVFQTVAPRRLYWAGHPAMRVVQALYWLGWPLPCSPVLRIQSVEQGVDNNPILKDPLPQAAPIFGGTSRSVTESLFKRQKPSTELPTRLVPFHEVAEIDRVPSVLLQHEFTDCALPCTINESNAPRFQRAQELEE